VQTFTGKHLEYLDQFLTSIYLKKFLEKKLSVAPWPSFSQSLELANTLSITIWVKAGNTY
jgi:hypothetical protein